MTSWEWYQMGLDRGFCTEVFCGTHDSWPSTKEEHDELDETDPCIPMVRVIRDEVERKALE